MNDLDAGVLRRALPDWVPEVRYLAKTDSTNRQAAAWAGAGARHGSLVAADYQTAGRGRLDRRWLAPAGSSLLFSVVLRPRWKPEQLGLLGLAAGIAVCRHLGEVGVAASLKWPNDVLLGSRKVAGILAEAVAGTVVLGIGLNVRQQDFPAEIERPATSLKAHTGLDFSRPDLLAGIVRCLAPLVDGPADAVPGSYRPWCETLGRWIRADAESGPVEDRAVDIDAAGGLILAGGHTVRAGDVFEVGGAVPR